MENWRDIPGYSGLYQVSNLGNVKRLAGNNGRYFQQEHLLKTTIGKNGYLHVTLTKNSKCKCFAVHKIVALVFVQNPKNCHCVNHKNENKTDNRAENLEWCTQKYNNNYGTARFRSSVTSSIPIVQLTKDDKKIREFYGMHEAARKTGICVQNIHKCCVGTYKTAGGYKWKYAL